MKPFHRAILVTGAVLAVHAIALLADFYGSISWFDIPMHGFGGYAMAFLGIAMWSWFVGSAHIEGRGPLGRHAALLVRLGWVIGFVAVIGIGWEWFEYLCDQFFPSFVPEYRRAQPNLGDTMADFFFDVFGGLVGYYHARRYDR